MHDIQETILNARLCCALSIGWEEPHPCEILSRYGLQAYKDRAGQIRIFKPGLVGMILEPLGRSWRVAHIYTHPEHRRQGLARMLLAVARLALGVVRHCEHMSECGKAWALAVG